MIQCDCQENIERICKNMCQKDYNKKIEKKKYQHLNYVEKTQIERWYNIEKKACSEIAKLLNKSARTIQREIKRGMVENLTTQLEIKYVYSVDVSEKKYRYNMTAKGPNLKLDANYKLVEYYIINKPHTFYRYGVFNYSFFPGLQIMILPAPSNS